MWQTSTSNELPVVAPTVLLFIGAPHVHCSCYYYYWYYQQVHCSCYCYSSVVQVPRYQGTFPNTVSMQSLLYEAAAVRVYEVNGIECWVSLAGITDHQGTNLVRTGKYQIDRQIPLHRIHGLIQYLIDKVQGVGKCWILVSRIRGTNHLARHKFD